MPIIEPAIRPPSEAESFLLQVTLGCSSNTCTFCDAYKSKEFAVKDFEEIEQDIQTTASSYPYVKRVFLMDGDALVLNNNKLVRILDSLNLNFPELNRISSYANGFNITKRTHEELLELREKKLSLVYIGLESGSQNILSLRKKKSTVSEMIDAVSKARKAEIKSSVMVLLGLGGKEFSGEHIRETIVTLNAMQPRYLSFLTLMLVPGTELYKDAVNKNFTPLNQLEFLGELYEIIKGLDLKETIVRANHASNYLPLKGTLGKDKEIILKQLEAALNGELSLRHEFMRGL